MGFSAGVESVRLAEWLGHGVSPDLLCRVLAVPRLETAVQRMIDRRLGPASGPSGLEPCVASLLATDGLALLWLAQRAGAVWHGRAILRVVDGAMVRALIETIGFQLRLVAIRHAALAADLPAVADGAGAGTRVGKELLVEAIAADGVNCVGAWCAAQPPALGRRVLLRLPRPVSPGGDHHRYGPAIVDALLREHV